MKYNPIIGVLFLLVVSCESSREDQIRDFIPGTYARFSDHDMRTEYDTLVISEMSGGNKTYEILKTSRFQKKLDGTLLPWEFKREELIAIYDEEHRILNETKKGKVIAFIPEKDLVLVNGTEYCKIK